MLVRAVEIAAEDAVSAQGAGTLLEEAKLGVPHAVRQHVIARFGVQRPPVVQVERQETVRVAPCGDRRGFRHGGMKILARLALDEQRIRARLQDLVHRADVGLHQVLQRRQVGGVAFQPFVPQTPQCRIAGAHIHLVDRRVQPDPWIAAREGAGVGAKQFRKIRVLEVADPVRDAEVAQIRDRLQPEPAQFRERRVGKRPVVAVRPEPGAVQRHAIAQRVHAEACRQREVLGPAPVVAALVHLVAPDAAVANGRAAVLDAGREQERQCSGQTGPRHRIPPGAVTSSPRGECC
jgi:hypothetical protein